ncbi:hypothetical protein H3V53_17555 [Paraburkholderia bengalensis]|uniref:Uncharacterized protein n=1 Tax=Paraburkholderia bengalensis TaxID=2747562 RepID=A0ABU8ITL3_9BURK
MRSSFCEGTKILESLQGWNKAFWAVLSAGSPTVVGQDHKWKQLLLSLCVTCTLCMPFLTFYWSLPYQGRIPSDEHLLKVKGSLLYESTTKGVNHELVARIVDEQGHSFVLQDALGVEQLRDWERQTGLTSVFAEGFFLRDGAGLFWPTHVISSDGKAVVTREEQKKKLEKSRSYIKQTLFTYLFIAPFWLMSLNHIRKVKRMIGA